MTEPTTTETEQVEADRDDTEAREHDLGAVEAGDSGATSEA